ncbi:SecY-interacting protein Syd, partial [Paenibacillus dendritiformis]|uniref:SecY-interacting protein Syd n=1 Tax=Paenibacillus dendritiformis TaxID=130049 RepID=UPI00156003BA|nr:SecY-interacting protein Syd [Paenibacillus dendritiformis]
MSVKKELAHYFDELLSYWNNTFGTLPKIPFDEEANPLLYQGEPDEDEYVSWKPIVKEEQEYFEAIETNINLHLHPSIKEYFTSFWFLN